MKLLVTKDTTSKTHLVFIQDSSSTTGAGLTGLAWNTASLSWYYYREGAGTGATQVTLATQTIGTWATGGFVELDATDMPGWYEIGVPNAALATGADFVGMVLKGATNMAQLNLEIQLTDFDVNDGTRGGLTALPNAAADAAGGLPISDAGGFDVDAIPTVANILTTQMTEAYAADGVAPTLAQALFLIQQAVTEFAYSGTTNTVKKLDGSTTAATFTLDDATNPTSQTRAT